jgi:hypothetical protein
MQKDIFTKEQEDQIRKAFDRIDGELGLYKLDDDRDLESIFSKAQDTRSSQSWLSKRLHEVEAKLTKLTHAIEVLLDQNRAYEITEKIGSLSTASYLVNDLKGSTVVSSISDDLRVMVDKIIELNLALEKKQEESLRITESIVHKLSYEFEEKLYRLTLALEKQEELLRVAEIASSKNSVAKSEDFVKPPIESSPRQITQSQKQKHGRNGFSFLGDILASPTYAFASMLLIVSLGLAIVFQSSEINTLKQVEDPLRGGKEIFQIVENPLEAAQSFLNELISEDITYKMEFESKDKIKIKIPVNEKTVRLMSAKRIELPQEKQCVLVFEKAR